VDVQNLVESRNAFAADMLPYLIVIAVVLIIAAWIQVRIGLAPLARVRHGVMEIRSGRARRLEHEYPDEVMPLIDEINGLLKAQEQAIERARTWTADLAHGLKTPLMVLTADAQRLREQGDRSIADNLDQLAETMSKRVDRELVRARVRSGLHSRGTYSDVGEVIHRIVRTLQRSPNGARLEWSVQVSDGIVAAIPAEDLTELLGNIAENAVKWARKAVSVSAESDNGVCIRIEDDGPGVEQDQLKHLGQRGVRLDEQKQGSGLGLAIARDVTEAYDGELSYDSSAKGGLVVTVRLQ
jgi:signal transduction histidine kinase